MSSVIIYDERARSLFLPNENLKKIVDGKNLGVRWGEGVLHDQDLGVIFSDIPNNRIMIFDEKLRVLQENCGFTNGRTIDCNGDIITASHGARGILLTKVFKGQILKTEVLVDSYRGKRLNSPNDVIVKSDGSVWFSDPAYGILSDAEGVRADSEIGADFVYKFCPKTREITAVVTDCERPNGLAFSPDEKFLYVSDTSASHDPAARHEIRIYAMNDRFPLAGRRFFGVSPGLPDGFRVDVLGFLFVSCGTGVQIFDATGVLCAEILIPEITGNLTFGGENFDTLFVIASTSLYAIRLNTRGAVNRRVKIHGEKS